MKTSVITDEISQDFREAAELAVRFGLDALELRSAYGRDPFELESGDILKIRGITRDAGLAVCAIASPLFKCRLDNSSEIKCHLEGLKRCLEAADLLGARLIRGFSFWRGIDFDARLDEIAERLGQAAELMHGSGCKLVLESDPSVYATNGAKLAKLLRATRSEYVAGLWDPGNDLYDPDAEEPYPDGYQHMKPYIAHVHLKDAVREGAVTRATPLGLGAARINELIARLALDGYKGYISLETHYRPNHSLDEEALALPKGFAFSLGGYEATEESLSFLKKMFSDINKETAKAEQTKTTS